MVLVHKEEKHVKNNFLKNKNKTKNMLFDIVVTFAKKNPPIYSLLDKSFEIGFMQESSTHDDDQHHPPPHVTIVE
jgi:hypothetical protein